MNYSKIDMFWNVILPGVCILFPAISHFLIRSLEVATLVGAVTAIAAFLGIGHFYIAPLELDWGLLFPLAKIIPVAFASSGIAAMIVHSLRQQSKVTKHQLKLGPDSRSSESSEIAGHQSSPVINDVKPREIDDAPKRGVAYVLLSIATLLLPIWFPILYGGIFSIARKSNPDMQLANPIFLLFVVPAIGAVPIAIWTRLPTFARVALVPLYYLVAFFAMGLIGWGVAASLRL